MSDQVSDTIRLNSELKHLKLSIKYEKDWSAYLEDRCTAMEKRTQWERDKLVFLQTAFVAVSLCFVAVGIFVVWYHV